MPGLSQASPATGDVMASRATFNVFFPQLRDLVFVASPPNEGVIQLIIKRVGITLHLAQCVIPFRLRPAAVADGARTIQFV